MKYVANVRDAFSNRLFNTLDTKTNTSNSEIDTLMGVGV